MRVRGETEGQRCGHAADSLCTSALPASGRLDTLAAVKKPLTIRSAADLLTTARKIRQQWGLPEHREMWFRAEDDKHLETRLQPKLYRPEKGKPRKTVSDLLNMEDECHEEFWRCADQLCEVKPDADADWDWYFLSQHHGVPTGLLDWSDGALVALHFAVRNKVPPIKTDSTIYVLDPYWLLRDTKRSSSYDDAKKSWNKYCRKRKYEGLSKDDWDDIYLPWDKTERKELPLPPAPLLWDSPHVSRRVAAQRSRFMIFGSDPEWMSRLADTRGTHFQPIHIPKDCMNTIRHELRDAGVTESVIFPDLDGLGREVEQKWADRL
jgi:FRG domain